MADEKFINISERYGEQVEVTLDDLVELNPSGEFMTRTRWVNDEYQTIVIETLPDGKEEIVAVEWISEE